MAGAVVTAFFYIVVFRQGRDHGCAAGDLADAVEDHFGAAVVELDGSMNFDGASGEAADITDIFQAGREDYHREGTGHLVLTEVEEVDAFRTNLDSEDFSGDALGFADVLVGFVNGDAVGGVEGDRQEQWD